MSYATAREACRHYSACNTSPHFQKMPTGVVHQTAAMASAYKDTVLYIKYLIFSWILKNNIASSCNVPGDILLK